MVLRLEPAFKELGGRRPGGTEYKIPVPPASSLSSALNKLPPIQLRVRRQINIKSSKAPFPAVRITSNKTYLHPASC
jgi:hypothetical protein